MGEQAMGGGDSEMDLEEYEELIRYLSKKY